MHFRRSMFLTRVRGLVVGLVVAASSATALLGLSLATPGGAAGVGPLPACRYDDVLTRPRDYDDWAITLVDTILEVTRDYIPPDLVPVSEAGIGGSGQIRAVALSDLRAMTAAAKTAGNPIAAQSSYRSYATQEAVFESWVRQLGYQKALLASARPGHSEHQLGLAIDFKSAGSSGSLNEDWGTTRAGTWMRRHAWEYGWVMSYPQGKTSLTCYEYEPWHFRYVGRTLAAKIHASGLTPREYLWAHFTTASVPFVSTSPRPTAKPAASPAASAPASPKPVASAQSSRDPEASPGALPSGSLEPASSDPPSDPSTPTETAGGGASPASVTSSPDAAPVVAVLGLVLILAVIGIAIAIGLRRRRRSGPGL